MSTTNIDRDSDEKKQAAKEAFLAAWNQKGSTPVMTDLEKRTAENHFQSWWSGRD